LPGVWLLQMWITPKKIETIFQIEIWFFLYNLMAKYFYSERTFIIFV